MLYRRNSSLVHALADQAQVRLLADVPKLQVTVTCNNLQIFPPTLQLICFAQVFFYT